MFVIPCISAGPGEGQEHVRLVDEVGEGRQRSGRRSAFGTGRNPYDRALTDLIGELSTRSEPFRKWWAAHNVRYHQTGRKRLHHPTVGDLELDYEVMELSADSGLLLAVFSAAPGSRSAEALDLLASWTATPEPVGAPGEARGRER